MDPTNDDVTYESVAHDDGLHIDGHGTDDESTTQLDLHSFSGDDVTTKDININTDGDMTEPIESNTNINQEVFSDDISRYSQDGQPGHESGDSDSKQGEGPLEDFDWAHLEHRFQTVMQQKQDEEAKIQEELARLVQVKSYPMFYTWCCTRRLTQAITSFMTSGLAQRLDTNMTEPPRG